RPEAGRGTRRPLLGPPRRHGRAAGGTARGVRDLRAAGRSGRAGAEDRRRSPSLDGVLRVLTSPRMLAFHALLLVVVPSFIALGFWQYGRAEDKAAAVEQQESNLAADPVPIDELTSVGGEVAREDRWRRVTVTGTYDAGRELLVRNRNGSGGVGMHVLTPLVTEDGTAVLVNRGWVAQPPTATARPEVPPAAEGKVTVVGRL